MTFLWRWLAGDPATRVNPPDHESGNEIDAGNGPAWSQNLPNHTHLLGLFLLVGLAARLVRYYLCFPLWDDESFLCVNFIGRTYAELLKPLDYHQVAPVLFLWMERLSVRLLGFSEYSLRLIPFLSSLASVVLFRHVAGRLLAGPALLFAVAVFAVSYPEIRYAAEAKPYGTDLLLSLVMVWLVIVWKGNRDSRILLILSAIMPICLGMSYPAVFTAGGLSLVVAAVLFLCEGRFPEWRNWVLWNGSLVASFGLWFILVAKTQSGAEGEFMGEYWKQNFPPMNQPWQLPYWLLKTHASDFLAYPLGGPNWASSLTFVLCLAGLWHLIRGRQYFWLGLLLAPAGLHFLAAALQKYPYGGHVKFSQYLAPMICCLIAVGIVQLLEWRERSGFSYRTGFVSTLAILLAIGGGNITRDLISPYKTRSDERARSFAKSFWPGTHYAEEVACLKGDWGLDFVPEQHRELSWSAHYYCNRAIEFHRSSLHAADLTRVTNSRPLRCVLYRDARFELDQHRLDNWLTEMSKNYEMVAHDSVPLPRLAKNDRRLVTMEYVDSYKFVPRSEAMAGVSHVTELRNDLPPFRMPEARPEWNAVTHPKTPSIP